MNIENGFICKELSQNLGKKDDKKEDTKENL